MATKDRRKLQHIHSSIADKQPTPQSLEVGEIAVNNSANKEFLSLKNSNDKVVRFSSDSTIIDWIENKEVMAYQGQVRGAEGPSGTEDDKHSYGITNDDLLQNKSNIVIKLNQVAAKKTVKYDVVNDAEDIYGNKVNPSTDGGKTDGAGFAIDMSRYAMIGANPSFSSVTVTNKTDLSGDTTINGDLTVTGDTTLAATSASSVSATSVTSPSISGTNVSAQTINATSIIKSPVISGTNVNGLSINGTNISGTTVKGDTISGTNITASNKVTTNELDTSGNVNLSNIVTIDTAAGQCVTINRNLCVNGVVTAQQQIYSSDRNLKENISLVTDDEMDKVANINYKSYNFKNDENKSKIYGVIAQDVQDAGLNELVYTNEDGNLAVDYTSLMILKLAHLRKVNDNLVAYMSNVDYRIAQLEKRIKELEEKNK